MILKIHLPEGQNVCIKQRENVCCRSFCHSSLINKNIYILSICLISKTTTLNARHKSLYISSPFLRGYDVKILRPRPHEDDCKLKR